MEEKKTAQETESVASEKKKRMRFRIDSKMLIIYLAVGVYLMYLGIKLIADILTDYFADGVFTNVFPFIAGIVFVVAGIWLAILCVRSYVEEQHRKKEEDETKEKE